MYVLVVHTLQMYCKSSFGLCVGNIVFILLKHILCNYCIYINTLLVMKINCLMGVLGSCCKHTSNPAFPNVQNTVKELQEPYTCMCMYNDTHARMHARMHARTHARTHPHTHTHKVLYIHACV